MNDRYITCGFGYLELQVDGKIIICKKYNNSKGRQDIKNTLFGLAHIVDTFKVQNYVLTDNK
jgi:hypothetical protein